MNEEIKQEDNNKKYFYLFLVGLFIVGGYLGFNYLDLSSIKFSSETINNFDFVKWFSSKQNSFIFMVFLVSVICSIGGITFMIKSFSHSTKSDDDDYEIQEECLICEEECNLKELKEFGERYICQDCLIKIRSDN